MRGLLKTGGAVQAASALTLVAQNLVAPRLMGGESYGQAVALLALPLLLQGLIEPMVNGAAIAGRLRRDHFTLVRQTWTHVGLMALPAAALTLAHGAQREATVWHLALLACFVVLVVTSTALRGLAFAGQRHRVLVAHYLGALLVTVAATPLLASAGIAGYLAMMCFVQVAVLIILLGDRGIRAEAGRIVCESHGRETDFPFIRNYVANLAVRASQLTLGPGMLVAASTQLAPGVLAEFRVCQTLAGALAYAVPVHSTLIQAHAASSRRVATNEEPSRLRITVRVIAALGVGLAGLATAALWLLYPEITAFLLRRETSVHEFRDMIWAAPFFVSLPLLGGLLLGMGLQTIVLVLNLLLIPLTLAIGLWHGAAAGFAVGSLASATSLAVAAWWFGRDKTKNKE